MHKILNVKEFQLPGGVFIFTEAAAQHYQTSFNETGRTHRQIPAQYRNSGELKGSFILEGDGPWHHQIERHTFLSANSEIRLK